MYKESFNFDEQDSSFNFFSEEDFSEKFVWPEFYKDNPVAENIFNVTRRLLCGSDPTLTVDQISYVIRFLEDFIKEPYPLSSKEDIESYEKWEERVNDELSARLKEYCSFSFNDSLFSEQRKILNIKNPEEEKPFEIKVLTISSNTPKEQVVEWQSLVGAPDCFTWLIRQNREASLNRIIYLPDYYARVLLSSDEHRLKEAIKNVLIHEYRHTQNSVTFGGDGKLFRFIDEALTDVVGYEHIIGFLRTLFMTTDTVSYVDFLEAYENADNKLMARCFEELRLLIGDMGLLVIGGKSSSHCFTSQDGLSDLPLCDGEFNENDLLRFGETIFRFREEHCPDWHVPLRKVLQKPTVSVKTLKSMYHYVLEPFFRDMENTDARCMKLIADIFEEELFLREGK